MSSNVDTWDEDKIQQLRELYLLGLSASQIGHRLGGLTRNAVSGKLHRLGLMGKGPTAGIKLTQAEKDAREAKRRENAGKRQFQPRQVSAARPILRLVPIEPLNMAFEDLSFNEGRPVECRYPTGEATFCGHPVYGTSSWCREHFDVVVQPRIKRA